MRGRNQLDAASGTMPRRAKTKPKRASSLAMRMSIGSCIVTPTPTAGPFTAAITGFRHSKIASVSRPPPSRTRSSLQSTVSTGPASRSLRAGLVVASKVLAPPERSAPAQNARPAPVTITAPTSSSVFTLREDVDHLAHHLAR